MLSADGAFVPCLNTTLMMASFGRSRDGIFGDAGPNTAARTCVGPELNFADPSARLRQHTSAASGRNVPFRRSERLVSVMVLSKWRLW